MTLLTGGATAAALNAPFVSDERLYLDKDGNVVKEGDPARVELLVGKGGVLPHDKAVQYGLIAGTTEDATETIDGADLLTGPVSAAPVIGDPAENAPVPTGDAPVTAP